MTLYRLVMYPVEYHDEGNNWEVDGLPYELNENEYVGMLYFEGDDQQQFPYTPGKCLVYFLEF